MNKRIVRLLIFTIPIYWALTAIVAWLWKIDIQDYWYVLALEYVFYQTVKTQGKYQCKFARGLALGLFTTDLLTYLDSKFNFIPSSELHLKAIIIIWVISVASFIYMAIKHFKRASQLKQLRNDKQHKA